MEEIGLTLDKRHYPEVSDLQRLAHVALEDEGDDDWRGCGLSLKRRRIEFPGFDGADGLLGEGWHVVDYANLFGLA